MAFAGQSVLQPTAWNPFATQPLQQQIQQLLQSVPQQLQQLQQLQYLQQHQLQQLQQTLQSIPVQLAHAQYVMQATQMQPQPFGSPGLSALPLWSASPQAAGAQAGYLM
jgi:hypothetical protein